MKIFYISKNEKFEIEHSTKMFNADIKYPKQVGPQCLKEFEGNLIYNINANVLENSWEIVYASQYLAEVFKNTLKYESTNYLYRHYLQIEGVFTIPMIESIGVDNFYEVQFIDTRYPTYDISGKITDKTITKLFHSFTFSARDFIPLKSGSYMPSFYNAYKYSNVMYNIVEVFEKKKYANRFLLPTEYEVANLKYHGGYI